MMPKKYVNRLTTDTHNCEVLSKLFKKTLHVLTSVSYGSDTVS